MDKLRLLELLEDFLEAFQDSKMSDTYHFENRIEAEIKNIRREISNGEEK